MSPVKVCPVFAGKKYPFIVCQFLTSWLEPKVVHRVQSNISLKISFSWEILVNLIKFVYHICPKFLHYLTLY